jgi:leucyl-tRNA synthetase
LRNVLCPALPGNEWQKINHVFQMHVMTSRYPVKDAESRWQQVWEQCGTFRTPTGIPARPYYVLEMFPYPSGNIHMGHVRNYTLGDVITRFRKAQGYDVLHPMGWDAFGLPAENAALKGKVHPAVWTEQNIATMRQQLQSMGLAYDWSREIATCRPEYYRHEQKFFLDFLKRGLAYRKEAWVNWDPVENTVLANEQVIDGKGWRSGALVEKRKLSQWFLRITDYAEELLAGLDTLDGWPEKVRLMQAHWLGKSSGLELTFDLVGQDGGITVFTTRPDTLFGVSFLAISPNHPLADSFAATDPALAAFIRDCNTVGTSEAAIESQEKKGYCLPLSVRHPLDDDWQLPVYVANFVLMEYGSGALFGCPAHDQRDLEFARKYDLPVLPVVLPPDADPATFAIGADAYTGDGTAYNSHFLDGLPTQTARAQMIEVIAARGQGQGKTTWRLRDWGISRQRYWGCPIPVIHCPACGVVPVPEDRLPVTLPEDVTFDQPGNPLARHPTWKHVSCPVCGAAAVRETDTFDTFFESSWYFARYLSPHSADTPFDRTTANAWMPVQQYIGGVEHAVLHLLYARFFTKALRDCGYLDCDEPFRHLMTQGMICHRTFRTPDGEWLFPDEVTTTPDGTTVQTATGAPVLMGRSEKMSKSLRNVVDPRPILATYGADTARLFMLSDSPPERDMEWTDAGVDGAWRYVNRLWRLVTEAVGLLPPVGTPVSAGAAAAHRETLHLIHTTIRHVTEDLERFAMNRAVARIRELSNALEDIRPGSSLDVSCQSQKISSHSASQPRLKELADGPMTEAEGAAQSMGRNLMGLASESAAVLRHGLEVLVQLLAPMLPHLAESLWEQLGHPQMVCETPWPVAHAAWLQAARVTIAVQVNGKLRGTLDLPPGTAREAVETAALSLPGVVRHLEGRPPRKVIVVPDKLVNVVG